MHVETEYTKVVGLFYVNSLNQSKFAGLKSGGFNADRV